MLRPQLLTYSRWGVLALLAMIVALTLAGTAHADPWGTNTSDTGAHPDADPHTYCWGSGIDPNAKPNINVAERDALDPTAVNVNYESSCDYSSSSETDVVWKTGNLPSGVRGQTYCEDFDTYCDQNYATLDLAEINIGSDDQNDQDKTACHELGHTAGMTHTSAYSDCMISGERPSSATQWERYATHHKNHLANWF